MRLGIKKAFKVCLVACMRKLLILLNPMARSGERFDATRGLAKGVRVAEVV